MIDTSVRISDYEISVHKLMTVLNMVGFQLSYKETDLLWRTLDLYDLKEDEFSMQDAIDTKLDWEKHWLEFYLDKNKKKVKFKDKKLKKSWKNW